MPERVREMPVLPLRGLNAFPQARLSLEVGRETSAKALEEALEKDGEIFVTAQRELMVEEPEEKDLYAIGTLACVRQIVRMPGGLVRVMLEGKTRGKLSEMTGVSPCLRAKVEELPERSCRQGSNRLQALLRETFDLLRSYSEHVAPISPELLASVYTCEDPGRMADEIAQNTALHLKDKQAVLEELFPVRRLEKLCRILSREIEVSSLEEEIEGKVRTALSNAQREELLREQIKAIRQELGEDDGEERAYREKIRRAKLPAQVEEKLLQELGRLEKQPFGSAEAAVLRNYLDVCLELPWGKRSKERLDLAAARRVLDADHYGLEKVKERLLEFLAVRKLSPEIKGQVLCLVGPPGVGKTSVAMSVARASGRKFARISLGGVHDEAEIRGHRKTYVGAMPGRIISALRQAGSSNPVLLLDEIDKLSRDAHGDPSSALLEVLDGEQNSTFRDNFLELPYDLSGVLFITTANTTDSIPRPLLDRMEVIELTSYTDEEKLQIAKRHLLPKELKRHGLKKSQLKLTDASIREIIALYTRESGVRVLERELAAVCRKAAMRIADGNDKQIRITGNDLEEFLGVRRYQRTSVKREDPVGVVNGLAWTQAGGELLEVEANAVPGSGKIELTGNLGSVMKESAQAALTYIRSRTGELGIDGGFYQTKDLHIHFPEGAVPKDGPSAGVAITTALVSALTGIPVRHEVAMTGEITLRGRVLAIGGLKEKTMAALRSGVREVVIPAENVKDLEEIDQTVRAALRFIPVKSADEVLAVALTAAPQSQSFSRPAGRETAPPDWAGIRQ